jgi:hypothetical protein
MFGERQVLRSEVRAKRHTDRISIASPRDFVRGRAVHIGLSEARDSPLLPYCLDFVSRRSLYVGGVDLHAAQAAPFYYLHLRRSAGVVVAVPWECGALSGIAPRAPILLFSAGRCGSTLLSQILVAAGVATVSEPDFFTQATSASAASPLNPLRARVRRASGNMGRDLCAALAPAGPLVAKLRAESCRAPEQLLSTGERRTLFMTRGFEDWARSTEQAFRNPPRKAVRKYLRALKCYEILRRRSECFLLRYESLMSDPAGTCAALAAFLRTNIAPEAISVAMAKDSQEGTPLAQGAHRDAVGSTQRLEATLALWNSARVRRVRRRLAAAGAGED